MTTTASTPEMNGCRRKEWIEMMKIIYTRSASMYNGAL
jgi:hypothetical protein